MSKTKIKSRNNVTSLKTDAVSIKRDRQNVIIECQETMVIVDLSGITELSVEGDMLNIFKTDIMHQVCCKTFDAAKTAAIKLHKMRTNDSD